MEPAKKEFTREDLVKGIKNRQFKRIVVLTGAGISVSAGIPDFRSAGTGLYANLSKYNLPKPEAIFDLEYFKENPEPFYKLAKELFVEKEFTPAITHYFLRLLASAELLHMNFTQNIDGLEVIAGVDLKYVVEAHGNIRSAHCTACKKEANIREFMWHLKYEKIRRCECSGLIKPDIVFFGEDLPKRFYDNMDKIKEADLVIAMGTSLKVMPFAGLMSMVPEGVPIVYINRENTEVVRENLLFMEGEIDEQVLDLIKDLGWEIHLSAAIKRGLFRAALGHLLETPKL